MSARAGDFLEDNAGGFDAQTGAAVFLRDQRREIARGSQLRDKFIRILAAGIQFLPVLAGEFGTQRGYSVSNVLVIIHKTQLLRSNCLSGDKRISCRRFYCHSANVIKRFQKTSYVNVLIHDIL